MSDEPHKERIWPVFVLAAAVVVLGTWLAFAAPAGSEHPSALPEPFITPVPAIASTAGEAPLSLGPRMNAVALNVDLRQERRRGDDVLRTRLALTLIESAVEDSNGGLVWERSFENVDVSMTSEGRPLGPDVAREVERLLETARLRIRARRTGEVVDTQVISAEAAQLRQLLSVIGDTLNVVHPRIPREAVRFGEPWEWTVPVVGKASDDLDVNAEGKTRVVARVLGSGDDGSVIDLQFEGHVDLAIGGEEETSSSRRQGTGRGVAIWDGAEGLVQSDVRWEQSGTDVSTIVRAHISRTGSTESD